MVRPGNQPSCIACRVNEKAPVMIAWLAMIVARVARATSGITNWVGASLKNGLLPMFGLSISRAVWPA